MKLDTSEILERARAGTDAATVGRVFGTPIERDGVTVIPVAIVGGGAGGGGGGLDSPDDEHAGGNGASAENSVAGGNGSGGGYGFGARPAGVYVIRDGDAHWRPAIDVNKIVIGGQLVAVAAFLLVRAILRRRH
ncbi:hypothetical protein [Actinoplanes derwentensis]|uniref:Sporulation protein YtfJ (Spore_YtfJ) n=1 Tax=Actinoplanes derwentensis TaxID=113562 RepID=A0A1H2ATG3_9ACTN|nr:hypothetical protein [Actinoplanes derwentensis]GID84334.1 hypothetical protein Ade03nite_32580 [Actinoplanes derwentensis]SDT49089.1 hypothetical protein SAMN04489716_4075 [Actinoplanes derwentensis]